MFSPVVGHFVNMITERQAQPQRGFVVAEQPDPKARDAVSRAGYSASS
jgi:hypothetical protein